MRHLRQTLKSLSPVIFLVPVLCGIISAQSGLTTIQDTLFDADGARYNGTLTIQWSTFDTTNPGTIIQQSKTVQVVNGNLLVQLAPNNTATPPANVYNVLYESDGDQQYSETWTVPVSANALTVAQVRTGGGVGSTGGGSVGGLTGGTGTAESSITNLVSDLNARPIKGAGFGTNAVAVIDQNGQIETAVGNLGDCVFVDGTTGPCSAGITLPTFVNGETPVGAVNGLNPTFTIANTPSGTSLLLFRNGLLAQAGVDYTLSGSTITFANQAIPQPLDTLLASYRIDPGSTVPGSGVSTGPSGSPGVNGCGAVNAASKNAAYQVVPADNGTLFIQTANAGFSLPVTPPAAGWCIALLNTGGSNVSVNNSGNKINGATAAYQLQGANSVMVFSDGSGYWVTGANGASGPAGPSGVAPAGTGTVQVTNGTAGLVSGSATNCVLVNGTSSTCGGAPGGSNGQIQYNNAGVFAGFTPEVNGTAISTPSALNLVNSAAFNGITLSLSNPSGGNVQLGASGTLNNSGLTNSSTTVNGQTCTLGSTCTISTSASVAAFSLTNQGVGTLSVTHNLNLAAGSVPNAISCSAGPSFPVNVLGGSSTTLAISNVQETDANTMVLTFTGSGTYSGVCTVSSGGAGPTGPAGPTGATGPTGASGATGAAGNGNNAYCADATGSTTTYACPSPAPNVSSLGGLYVAFVPQTTNTASSTLNVAGLGAVTLKQSDCASNLAASALTGGTMYFFQYNGTVFCQVSTGGGSGATPTVFGGRLTLSSGMCIPQADVTGAPTIYYTACGNFGAGQISLYNGASFQTIQFLNNTSLSLAGIVSGSIYDVFGKLSGGNLVLELSTAWSNNTTRSSALTTISGIPVQASDNAVLLGTIRASGSGVTSDSGGGAVSQVGGQRFVWNAYNKAILYADLIDRTNNWSYTSGTIRQANAVATDQIAYVSGEISENVLATLNVGCYTASSSGVATAGIGVDSTTTYSGLVGSAFNTNGAATLTNIISTYQGHPGIGYHVISWNESGGGTSGSSLFYGLGSQGNQSGITVQLFQ